MIDLVNELERLCSLNGISGDEGSVSSYIISVIEGHCTYEIDPLGNILAFKKGRNTPKNKLLVSAHMDEVGFIVNYITDDGYLKISPVGGIDPRVVFGRRVAVGDKRVCGVIGGKVLHRLSKEERGKAPDFDRLYIDIGAGSRAEAEEQVSLGDSVCFESSFERYGEGFLKGKAIDDRVGCAMMMKLITDEELEYDTAFTFVVQEEIGLRGSACAAYTADPDIAFVLEATTAADIPSASGEKRVCELGKGPVVSFMDRRTIYDKELYRLAFETAKEKGLNCQTKTMVAGGNDAGAIHRTRGGVRTCGISLPCRYLHSPCCVISEKDLNESYELVREMLCRAGGLQVSAVTE